MEKGISCKWKSKESWSSNTHIRLYSLYNKDCYKRQGRTPHDDQRINPRMVCVCLLSCFSPVWLFATLLTVAHQAPLSVGFSRQEYWSGLPFLSPVPEMKSESEVAQLCPTLCDPIDSSLPGSSVCGIFQARVLEWVAIAVTEVLAIGYIFLYIGQFHWLVNC